MIGLPTSLDVNGTAYNIRTDYRVILDIISAFNDHFSDVPNIDEQCKANVCMDILYEDFESIPQEDYEEAYRQALWFLDCGKDYSNDNKPLPKLMDWEQDEPILFPAINRVAGKEVRLVEYMHWWTFMGAYMEIGECLYSNVINIRQKLSKGKKLEKYEQEFYKDNRSMVDLKEQLTPEEEADKAALEEVLKKFI